MKGQKQKRYEGTKTVGEITAVNGGGVSWGDTWREKEGMVSDMRRERGSVGTPIIGHVS